MGTQSATCIVGYVDRDFTYMGGDSAFVNGWNLSVPTTKKICIKNNIIMGSTGDVIVGQSLRYALKLPEQKKNEKDDVYIYTVVISEIKNCFEKNNVLKKENNITNFDGRILLGYHGVLYKIGRDFSCFSRTENYDAVGCGEDFALGALYACRKSNLTPKQKILTALRAAANYSIGVRPPFCFKRIRNNI